MNTAQLKAKCRRLRNEQEEDEEVSGELNVIPYLDVVTNIVMFLLASMTTYQLTFGNLNITSPSRADPGAGQGDQNEPKEELNLSVFVTEGGFTIAARGGQLVNPRTNTTPTIETRPITDAERGTRGGEMKSGKGTWCPEELQLEWDYPALSKKLAEFKYGPNVTEDFKKETKVILTANPGVCYNVLVRTMDAVRKDTERRELFPDVILSAGVQ
jgi:biopolymer transport protein TolR